MIQAAQKELEAVTSRGDKIEHKDFETIYAGIMVLVACVSTGLEEATANANAVKELGGRWQVAEERPCEASAYRRHVIFEFIQQ